MSTQAATARRSWLGIWLPVVVWAGVIFAFSSVPSLSTELGTWDTILRKLAHLAEYAVLGALLCRALRRPGLALVLATLYAVSDEVHQSFVPNHTPDLGDLAADTLGGIVGATLRAVARLLAGIKKRAAPQGAPA